MKWLNSLLNDDADRAPPSSVSDVSDAGAPPTSREIDALPLAPSVVVEAIAETAPETAETAACASPAVPDFAEPPAVESLRSTLETLAKGQQDLGAEQEKLSELFATRLRSDEAQARAVEKLHDELRQYKANFIRQQQLPLLKEVIFCHDFVSSELSRLREAATAAGAEASEPAGDSSPDGGVRALEVASQMLVDLLFKYDVEPFRSDEPHFDPKSQQCTRTVPSDQAELDKKIASRGLTGFRNPEGIVRREQVSVYKLKNVE